MRRRQSSMVHISACLLQPSFSLYAYVSTSLPIMASPHRVTATSHSSPTLQPTITKTTLSRNTTTKNKYKSKSILTFPLFRQLPVLCQYL
ncbi:hypothetical protein BDR07DRAFT_499281 [Suillus spraguei]|nr:hypothetical protein BDR07DRAFT_499281 [Suillus spraguei]